MKVAPAEEAEDMIGGSPAPVPDVGRGAQQASTPPHEDVYSPRSHGTNVLLSPRSVEGGSSPLFSPNSTTSAGWSAKKETRLKSVGRAASFSVGQTGGIGAQHQLGRRSVGTNTTEVLVDRKGVQRALEVYNML